MKLLPNVRFEEARLLLWRPIGVMNEAAVNQIISVLGDLEASSGTPFNRFSDTLATSIGRKSYMPIDKVEPICCGQRLKEKL